MGGGGAGFIGPNYNSTCSDSPGECLIFITAAKVDGAMKIEAASNYFDIEQPTLSGIAAANAICAAEAKKRFSTTTSTSKWWQAWLSSDSQTAGTAVYDSTKAYVNGAGVLVVPPGKLLGTQDDVRLLATIAPSVLGAAPWTGTDSEGNVSPKGTCSNWTSTAGEGSFGQSITGTGVWTKRFGTELCNTARELYCFEQKKSS